MDFSVTERLYRTEEEVAELYQKLIDMNAKWLANLPAARELIDRAYKIAYDAHKNVPPRKSGEPYIIHPIIVAMYASQIYPGDINIILAALLHDVVEDTPITLTDIAQRFPDRPGLEQIVDGVTKLKEVHDTGDSSQVENFRKLLNQTINDNSRIILLKLADRLHNMQTLQYQESIKQQKIASETLTFYVPIAERLNLYTIKTELENLSFKYLYPSAYKNIEAQFETHRARLAEVHRVISGQIDQLLSTTGLDYKITSREKTPYSTYKKLTNKHILFEEIYDLVAFRIVFKPHEGIPESTQCWFIYMLLTDVYPALHERTRDWVSAPKVNGYEALHCTLMDKNGQWVEVQIRTERMNENAENGGASHWRYKRETDVDDEGILRDIGDNLGKLYHAAVASSQFMAHINTDFLKKKITVYERLMQDKDDEDSTSTRREFILPRGSSVLDFAYLKSQNAGDHALGARVNGILTSLRSILHASDEVELIVATTQYPTETWSKIAQTPYARNLISESLHKQKEIFAKQGEQVLREMFNALDAPYSESVVESLLPHFKVETLREFYDEVHDGYINREIVYRELRRAIRRERVLATSRRLKGNRGLAGDAELEHSPSTPLHSTTYTLLTSPCCYSLPGDMDVKCLRDPSTEGKVVRVHKANCLEGERIASEHGDWLVKGIDWSVRQMNSYPTHIFIEGEDRKNLLSELFAKFADVCKTNISRVDLRSDGTQFRGIISFSVYELSELENLIQSLYQVDSIHAIYRLDVPSTYEFVDSF